MPAQLGFQFTTLFDRGWAGSAPEYGYLEGALYKTAIRIRIN